MSAASTPRPRSMPSARKATSLPAFDEETREEEVDYLYSDGEEMESQWHVYETALLQDLVNYQFRHRQDYYVGGNNFIHFRPEDALKPPQFRGPDFFFVNGGVTREPMRKAWLTYRENNRFPDVIIELLSKKTAKIDRTVKKDIYERVFHTREYYLYDPDKCRLTGWRLNGQGKYSAIAPNERDWLWSEVLGLWLGTWQGKVNEREQTWLRFYDAQGRLVPRPQEAEQQRAEAERQRAEAEQQRASAAERQTETERQAKEAAQAEVARLKALLEQSPATPPIPKRKKRSS